MLNAQVVALATYESGGVEAIEVLERIVAELAAAAPESLTRGARVRLASLRAGRAVRAPWVDDPTLIFPAALPLAPVGRE